MTKTIFVTEGNDEDEFELLPHVDVDGGESILFKVNTVDCEHYIELPLHRNAAVKLAMKIIETLG